MDTNATIEFLEAQTDLHETAQVTTFRGHRMAGDGTLQEITIEVLDRGERAGQERYLVSFRDEDGKGGGSNDYADTVENAIGMALVHWQDLG